MHRKLVTNGFVLLDSCIQQSQLEAWSASLDEALERGQVGTLSSRNLIYGSRNLLATWPEAKDVPGLPLLANFVRAQLGNQAGLVRALFFDKPPGRSWSLPWHRDMTIAVRAHLADGGGYRCPTVKAGIPHVEAPQWLLERMLTLRVHFDPMTLDNGPLVVISGSHHTDEKHAANPPNAEVTTIQCPAGGVLAMRPLLSHSSLHATPGNQLRRRILHFEFARDPELTSGYHWHTFWPLFPNAAAWSDLPPS